MATTQKKTAQHTPGPWGIGDSGTRSDGIWIEPTDKNANVLADIVGRLNDGEDTQITDEDIANARLIAAAPDLLAAANLALEYFEQCVMSCDPDEAEEESGDVPEAAKLRAAILKATGA
jgi:antitoxin (DNA-binding transcriptional repressor) of toxin-antitoxin stability system